MTTATPRPSLPSSSQAGKDKDFFLISQARNAHPCITPSPKPTPSIVKSFSLYNRRPSAFQHRQDKKRRFYGPRSISDGTPVRGAAQKVRASTTSSSSGSTVPLLPRTHDTTTFRDAQSLDSASLHDSAAAPATAVTVNNRNSAPTSQPAINFTTSSNPTSTPPTTMPPTPTVTPGDIYSPSSTTLPSIQRTPSRFFVHHPLSTTIDSTTTTTMPLTTSSPLSPPSSPPKPSAMIPNNSLSTVLHHHSPGAISRRNAVHGRGGATVPAFATVSSAMLVPEPLRIDVGTRHVRRQGITAQPSLSPSPLSPPLRLRPQMQLQQQQPSSTQVTGTTGSSSMAFTASTQASSWSSSSAAFGSSGEAAVGVEKNQVAATPRRLLFPRRAQPKEVRGGGGGTYPFSSSSFLARSALRDGKGGGKAPESGGEGVVVRRKPVSTNAMTAGCAPVHEKEVVREKKKSSNSRKGEGSARGESSNMDADGVGIISDGSYPEEHEKLEREILALLFTNCSSSSMSSSSERKLHELGGASSVISGGSSDEYHDCVDGYMPSSDTMAPMDRSNPQTNLRGLRPFPTTLPPLLDPRDEAQMYALMLEEEQSEGSAASISTSDSYARLNQTGWQSKLVRKSDKQPEDENQTLRQIIRQQRHQQQQPSPVSPPSPQLLPLPSPIPSPSPMPPRYRRNGTRPQSSGPPPAMRLPDPPVRSPPRLHRSRL